MKKCTVKLFVNQVSDGGIWTMSVEQAAELVCNNIYCQLTEEEIVTAIYENIDLTVHDLNDACKFARIELVPEQSSIQLIVVKMLAVEKHIVETNKALVCIHKNNEAWQSAENEEIIKGLDLALSLYEMELLEFESELSDEEQCNAEINNC